MGGYDVDGWLNPWNNQLRLVVELPLLSGFWDTSKRWFFGMFFHQLF